MLPAALVPAGAPQVMRLLLGVIIVAMAVYIALPGRFRDVAGQLAAPVTRRMMPFFGRFLPVKSLDNAIGLGLYRQKPRSEEHTSELQSRGHLVCRLLLEKKNNKTNAYTDQKPK